MTTKPLDQEDTALLTGCGAFVGALVRNIIITAIILAAVLTEGVLSGILWSGAALYMLANSITVANHAYRRRAPASRTGTRQSGARP